MKEEPEFYCVKGKDSKEKLKIALGVPDTLVDPETGITYCITSWTTVAKVGDIARVVMKALPKVPVKLIKELDRLEIVNLPSG